MNEELRRISVDRSAYWPLTVGASDADVGSRAGGAPPEPVVAMSVSCPICGGRVEYVLTLAGDVLGEEIARGKALSMLTCASMACRMKSHAIIEPSSLLLLVHDDLPRAKPGSGLDSPFEGRRLEKGEARREEQSSDTSGVGGSPGYIQSWGPEEAESAERLGRVFLFQWSEISYLQAMKDGVYPFLFGTVYVFARKTDATELPELTDLVGFWQNA